MKIGDRIRFQMEHEDTLEIKPETPYPEREGIIRTMDGSDWIDVEVKLDYRTSKIFMVKKSWIKGEK